VINELVEEKMKFNLTLQKSYHKHGFFNVTVDYDRYMRKEEGPIQLKLGENGPVIKANLNRTANINGTSRVYGGLPLREWFKNNCSPMDTVQIDPTSPDLIVLIPDRGEQPAQHTELVQQNASDNKIKKIIDVESNIRKYLEGDGVSGGLKPFERYCSFDYCFNYFQNFYERGKLCDIASKINLQQSCMQLGFYLASWGMLRGSSILLQKSAKIYEPVIYEISKTDYAVWQIDVSTYSDENINKILNLAETISSCLPSSSMTLVTKIILGVFGNVPAFDSYFKNGFGTHTFNNKSLSKIKMFYTTNQDIIDKYKIPTTDLLTGLPTSRKYTCGKVIDMCFFIEGGS